MVYLYHGKLGADWCRVPTNSTEISLSELYDMLYDGGQFDGSLAGLFYFMVYLYHWKFGTAWCGVSSISTEISLSDLYEMPHNYGLCDGSVADIL